MPHADSTRLLTAKVAPLSNFATLMRRLHIDGPLLGGLVLICGFGLFILYSAVGESNRLLMNQTVRLGVAFLAMLVVAQMRPISCGAGRPGATALASCCWCSCWSPAKSARARVAGWTLACVFSHRKP